MHEQREISLNKNAKLSIFIRKILYCKKGKGKSKSDGNFFVLMEKRENNYPKIEKKQNYCENNWIFYLDFCWKFICKMIVVCSSRPFSWGLRRRPFRYLNLTKNPTNPTSLHKFSFVLLHGYANETNDLTRNYTHLFWRNTHSLRLFIKIKRSVTFSTDCKSHRLIFSCI